MASPGRAPTEAVGLGDLRLRAVRARIAEAASMAATAATLGTIRLRPHQRLAVARVTEALARHGGCLLADDVGRGKTFVALAVAQHWKRPLVVVPASLRITWRRAMERACVPCDMVTHEALSRGALPPVEPDGIIVDESHRFRSPHARRHAALARLSAYSPILLLSATPLQNRGRDLAAQLAFFLGGSAYRDDEPSLARHVIRSAEGADDTLPVVAPPAWLETGSDDGAVLRAILALPPPGRPFDAGDAGALRTIGLVRAWASSRAALASALRRRMRAVTALEQCAANGLSPGRRDLRAWHGEDGDVQLVLAPLLISRVDSDGGRALLAATAAERAGLERLAAVLRGAPDADAARVAALRRLRAHHAGERILVFSEFARTVRALYALFRADHEVGLLTATEARIASGRLSREALLQRFAPAGQGAREPSRRERVTLLFATDLLSEGMNLQDASVVVHLDLPWNPARLAQRLGRIRRPGGAAVVHSYLMAPPATTDLLLRVDARLRAKLARAEQAIGRTLDVMPPLTASRALGAASTCGATNGSVVGVSAESLGAVANRVASWRRAARNRRRPRDRAPVAAAICDDSGWLAALDDGRLLARAGASSVNTGTAVAVAVERAGGRARAAGAGESVRALEEATEWLRREALTLACGMTGDASPLDAEIERRIARALARVPRHSRAHMLESAGHLRGALGRPRSLGAERELQSLMTAYVDDARSDAEWLARSLIVVQRGPARQMRSAPLRVVALIVFGASSGE